jgi:hypothetical protein
MHPSIRSLIAAAAVAAISFTAPMVQAAPGHGGGHGGSFAGHGGGSAGAFHGGYQRGAYGGGGYRGGYHGGGYSRGYRGGYYGHRNYWGPGVFWGGIGLGLGLGAIAYSNYSPAYYGSLYGDYYDGVYAAPPVVVLPSRPAYVAVDPLVDGRVVRSGQAVPQQARPAEPIFYPRNGQDAATLENDRRECNRWATTQQGAMADASVFQRATHACMDGRGYSVR